MTTTNWKRPANYKILAINFHYVRPPDPRYPNLHRRSLTDFSRQLDTLSAMGECISPRTLEEILLNPDTHHPEKAFVLTFDDGLKDHYRYVAPELDRRDWKAFFFVNSAPWLGTLLSVHRLQLLNATVPFLELYDAFIKLLKERNICLDPRGLDLERVRRVYTYDLEEVARFKFAINFELSADNKEDILQALFVQFLGDDTEHQVELYLSQEECRSMAEMGHTVGCHSHIHRPLSLMTSGDCAADLALNTKLIEESTNQKPAWISFPNGVLDSGNSDTLDACREEGINFGFTMNRGFIEPDAIPICLNRVDTNDAPGGRSPIIDW